MLIYVKDCFYHISMKKGFKYDTRTLLKIIGQHLRRHNTLLIIVLSAILLDCIAITIGWFLSPDDVSLFSEIAFYVIQSIFFLTTSAAIVMLIFVRLGKLSDIFLAIANHIYAAFLVAFATLVFCLDLSLGFSPLTYIIVITFVAGIFVVDPVFFAGLEFLSMIPIAIAIFHNRELFFSDEFFLENMVLFTVLVILIGLVCFRNHRVIYSEYKVQKKLYELSYNDELTGLLNERSYISEVEDIDNRIRNGEDVKFAVILMDVNNLKATNDAYGHRFGCSLVVRCGHTLLTLFSSSKLFHVGGDEFIAIVMGKDLEDFENTMKKFDEAMLYSLVEYEGKELIFSVARGYHVRTEGQFYKDVLQIADSEMYANKKYLKEKYNMKGR